MKTPNARTILIRSLFYSYMGSVILLKMISSAKSRHQTYSNQDGGAFGGSRSKKLKLLPRSEVLIICAAASVAVARLDARQVNIFRSWSSRDISFWRIRRYSASISAFINECVISDLRGDFHWCWHRHKATDQEAIIGCTSWVWSEAQAVEMKLDHSVPITN